MTRTRTTLGFVLGAVAILLAGSAMAEPREVAEYKDPRSGDLFELFQQRDGSFFCSIQRPDGSLSGFELQAPHVPAGAGGGEACPDIRSIVRSYYSSSATRGQRDVLKGRTCPLCKGRSKLRAENRVALEGDNARDACRHPVEPKRPDKWKTVSLLLLLMLSEQDAS
jgi:hypothetical protein